MGRAESVAISRRGVALLFASSRRLVVGPLLSERPSKHWCLFLPTLCSFSPLDGCGHPVDAVMMISSHLGSDYVRVDNDLLRCVKNYGLSAANGCLTLFPEIVSSCPVGLHITGRLRNCQSCVSMGRQPGFNVLDTVWALQCQCGQ
jgi:hypothetical protein